MSDDIKILCVDDEVRVLDGLENHLAMQYDYYSATSGAEGLEILAEEGPFAVVISDMRMPVMNGAQFLSEVRGLYPDTTRMLLTGQSDISSAIQAINQGNIFRFLSKPCPPGSLLLAVRCAVRQHKLILAEQDLLENTLRGAVTVLSEVIGLTNPGAANRNTLVKKAALHLCKKLGLTNTWPFELAATLSQLGRIALPPEILHKLAMGKPLDASEVGMLEEHPAVAGRLLSNIPRLESVAAMIQQQNDPSEWSGEAPPESEAQIVALGSNILAVALRVEKLLSDGLTKKVAYRQLQEDEGLNQSLVNLIRDFEPKSSDGTILALYVSALRPYMVLQDDVCSITGQLLLGHGHELNAPVLESLCNLARRGEVVEPIRVLVPN